jgi:hypothetical protein
LIYGGIDMGNSFYGNVSIGGGGVTPAEVDSKITANNIIEEGVMDTKDNAVKTEMRAEMDKVIVVSDTTPAASELRAGGVWIVT